MKPVDRCVCGCILSKQRIKTPNAIIVRYVCFRCYRTKRKFFMRGDARPALTLERGAYMAQMTQETSNDAE